MAIANTAPSAITFKKSVSLSTVDQNNSNAPVPESYVVSGPVSIGVSPIMIAGGTKAVIPLSSASGNGAPYLKIHFPTTTNNTLYVTYCVANSAMSDGYYDYKTGVPTAYYNSLRTWININPSSGAPYINPTPTVRTRSLKFSAYGATTNQPSHSVTFYVSFQGTFTTSVGPASGPSGAAITTGLI